ncbi:MAG: isoprenylcysteine carboxylmethyltransferase family protein [Peptoclostridium sp.]|uniref:methyltransferase family protein n=1 Tax=Peptoclostridium sp. TaxID=1904860 RepID=UPI00139E4C11|nr:isoprenylcysteine carboxylmethyltransferase family protein [Peptoclostridium sp.]MZQ75798.1 isoprenylcysteine carboxylmethyltransferase family protein [Peptoclostridium sp.]
MEDNVKFSKQKAFLVPVIISVLLALVLFAPAGSLRFWEAWVYWSGFTVLTLFIAVYFSKKDPKLLSRRMKYKEDETTRKPPAFLNLFFLCYVIPGLDFRFHWSAVPLWLVIAANAVVFLGYILIIFVFKENSYASTTIQVEKGQQVITTGPYAIVRHPMYLGLITMILFTPLALGSYWAIIPALLCIPMNVIRIIGEEEVLLRGLAGYSDYCAKTRYRLVPFIW